MIFGNLLLTASPSDCSGVVVAIRLSTRRYNLSSFSLPADVFNLKGAVGMTIDLHSRQLEVLDQCHDNVADWVALVDQSTSCDDFFAWTIHDVSRQHCLEWRCGSLEYDSGIFIFIYTTSWPRNRCFALARDFLLNANNFWLVRKWVYKIFLYDNHPKDSLKVIDQSMGFCIKIIWCQNHDNILFGQCENASTIHFLYGGRPNGTP